MGDREFTVIIGKKVNPKIYMTNQTAFQGIKARGKYSEHRGTQEMLLSMSPPGGHCWRTESIKPRDDRKRTDLIVSIEPI